MNDIPCTLRASINVGLEPAAGFDAVIQELAGALRTVLPDVRFEGKLVLQGPARSVELLDTGRGHTESDLILRLPAERIAFMGDVLFIQLV